jgi:2-dehydro-3-deoxygluconokinase
MPQTSSLTLRDAKSCKYDLVALGDCMIRLSPPGHGRVEFAPALEVWVGGGEYNVAYALARLGLRTAWVGGLNSSPMGKIVLNHGRAVGVDMSHAVTRKYDGYGMRDRIGLNFTEVGHGKRASTTLYDRGHSATASIKPGEVNWRKLFAEDGVRWFHTGGIFSALSENTRAVVAEAISAAHDAGTVVSYDLNFRSKLWKSEEAIRTTKPLVPLIDCLIGNEEDFEKVLGYHAEGVDVEKNELDTSAFKGMVERVVRDFPNVKVVGTTLRGVHSATVNDWSAIMWADGKFYDGLNLPKLEIEDRVGGGDGFASGFTYGFLTGREPQACVNLGVAHGAMLMSTRGDSSQIELEELMHVAGGGSARIKR